MRTTILLVLGVLAGVTAPSLAEAQIYRYTDERGTNHYVDGLAAVPDRYRATAQPLTLRNAPVTPSAELAVRSPETGETTISFTPGQRILTDARINDSASVRLLVDTGADRTVISPRALVAAGISLTRGSVAQQIQGATGTADARRVVVESIAVGRARVGRMVVFAHDINQTGFDGLLGRDFLEQFTVNIDPARGVVTLRPK
jgi:clan AA aspartic protease (TIGR02281 family)